MDNIQDQLFEMIGRLRQNGLNQRSKAAFAPVIKTRCNMIISENPNRIGNSKAGSTVVKKYDMGGSSTGEQIYQCGTHNFETRSLNEFNNHISTTHNEGSNKAKAIHDFLTRGY